MRAGPAGSWGVRLESAMPLVIAHWPQAARLARVPSPPSPYTFGFVVEHTVGHVTFAQRLHDAVAADPDVTGEWIPLGFEPRGPIEQLPPLSANWSLRASVRARARLAGREDRLDGLLFHTQTASLLCTRLMGRIPSLISVDATPRNYDEVATGYAHEVGDPRVEALKVKVVGAPMRAAAGVIAWSDWVRRSLLDDYGVADERIHLIPAGTIIPPAPKPRERGKTLKLLFVGGQFERKGGPTLLAALEGADFPYELDIVTKSPVAGSEHVRVHDDVSPGSAKLERLYAEADVFVLPTSADASPHVVIEAMAAGVAVVTTPVGAVPEMLGGDDCGRLVEPGDPDGLRAILAELAASPERRAAMAKAARARAEARFDAKLNGAEILALMKAAVDARRGGGGSRSLAR